MVTMLVQTLKGFRDFLPQEAKKRQYVINAIKRVCEMYGFEPLETPSLEYEEILLGKYGEEGDKLMYRFEDNGKRRVALRYDQTVPTARVVAQYANELPIPFKRYQVQNVWRAENTQKGRYREFIQFDVDTIGSSSPVADAEIILCIIDIYKILGFTSFKVLINDRAIFEGLPIEAIIIIDKLKKIGEEGVCKELVERKITTNVQEAKNLLQSITDKIPSPNLQQIMGLLYNQGVKKSVIEYSPTLARGLDYYTGMIFEIESPDYPTGSLTGGGRYDNLIGMFAKKKVPAVGFAFGFDRTIEAMEALNLFPQNLHASSTKVLVTIFNNELKNTSLAICSQLRLNNIPAEIYLDENAKMEKQLKYADQKQISYAIIIGPEEAKENKVTLKNLVSREQQTLSSPELISLLSQ